MSENKLEKEQASIHAINKNEMKESKRILTEEEKRFVNFLSELLIEMTFKDINEIMKPNDQGTN